MSPHAICACCPPGPQVSLKLPYSRFIEEPHSYMAITHHTIMNIGMVDFSSESDSYGDGEEGPKAEGVEHQVVHNQMNGSLIRRLVVSAE